MTIRQLLTLAALAPMTMTAANMHRTLLDHHWQFHHGDIENTDQGTWRTLCLPHDWSIEQAVDREAPAGNDGGYYPTGIGWYKKTIDVAGAGDNRQWLYIEGAYERSQVYVDGKEVGGHLYGFTSYRVDITDAARGKKQVEVAVKVDNSKQKNCRWYTGSGLYRHVWLEQSPAVHIDPQGVVVTTPATDRVVVKTTVVNTTDAVQTRQLRIDVPQIGEATQSVTLQPGEKRTLEQTLTASGARLWSPADPYRYEARVTLGDGASADEHSVRFGVRTVEWSADKGFLLNGQEVMLNGSCMHSDNGMLGAAAYDEAEYRRALLTKEAGFNAVRTAHNIPSEAFLDACDELGLLVIDEAFDGWRDEKNKHDYHEHFDKHWREDVQAMVARDINHPSIVAWSIGNEVIERKKIEVVTTARKLASAIKQLDPDRPVTSALASWDSDWEIYDPLAGELDITGYNYMIHKAEGDHDRVPERVMWQTESYPVDAFRNWAMTQDHKYVVGDFVWTGMDYIGESGIGRYWYATDTPGEHYHRPLFPWHGAYCGDIDLTGWRKPVSHYRDMLWNGTEKLYLAVREPDDYAGKGKITHGLWGVPPTWERWNWPGWEGKDIDVVVYSRYPKVRLYLDDKLIGEKATGRSEEYKAVFRMPYQPGVLKTVGVEDGVEKETTTLATTQKAVRLRLTADRQTLSTGEELSFITVEAVDAKGRVVPDAEVPFSIQLRGPLELAAAGSADLQSLVPYTSKEQTTWNGRALIVVRSAHKSGAGQVAVKAAGLPVAKVGMKVRK